jgi:sugar phosphate isomerase/epimerase
MLHSGALTQLEWLDRCASELALDGVEFAAAHFPRTDDDYLAQLKKLCVDRGLTAAAVTVDIPFGAGDVDRQASDLAEWIACAIALGAPLLRFSSGAATGSPPIAWRELVRGLKMVCAGAKEHNVTLALLPRESTQVASPAEVKRALKECDSAWLRVALTTSHLSGVSGAAWEELLAETTFVVSAGTTDGREGVAALRGCGYIGFVSIEYGGFGDEAEAVPRAVSDARGWLAQPTLERL